MAAAAAFRTVDTQPSGAFAADAAGLAHDLNNLLAIVVAASEALTLGLEPGSQGCKLALASLQAAERAQGLLAGAGRGRTVRSLDCRTVLASLQALVRHAAPGVELRVSAPDAGLFCRADAAELESALLNLCLNARDAMPNGGVLSISAEAAWVTSGGPVRPGAYVKFAVGDTGIGMTPEVLRHATERRFTTKGRGDGGLGLGNVLAFAQAARGGLDIQSREGDGATVSLYLPRTHGDEE